MVCHQELEDQVSMLCIILIQVKPNRRNFYSSNKLCVSISSLRHFP